MSTRPLDLLDLSTLYRYRGEAVSLDTARFLTRGNPLGARSFLSHFNPGRHIYTAVGGENSTPLLGSVIHTNGDSFARLLYLAPHADLAHPGLPALIEHLSVEAGKWGTFHVLAEVDEGSGAYRALRLAGFSVYAWQRLWDVSGLEAKVNPAGWRPMRDVDLPAMQSFHYQIVPQLIHPIEPPPQKSDGLVCCSEGMRGYVSITQGPAGIVMTPFIHPEVASPAEKLALLPSLPGRRGRPVYLRVRSYQAWLEPVLEDLGARASERQAVMVKHLVRSIKEEQTVPAVRSAVSIQPSRVSRIQKRGS
jgi:hypothetical protein